MLVKMAAQIFSHSISRIASQEVMESAIITQNDESSNLKTVHAVITYTNIVSKVFIIVILCASVSYQW